MVPPEALDVAPKKLTETYPRLPVRWLERSAHARVVAFLVVDANGQVVDAQIEYATNARWGALVLETVRGWRFAPGIRDGKPVPSYVRAPFEFRVYR
ncbi:MAG: TonB family protein [Verrucomicrobia bacterium]|nr:TonB family protein [Verrucomicrobiota bacterium]